MTEIHLDLLNFNSIFTILLVLLIGGYLYYEIHKLKLIISEIQYKLNQKDIHPTSYMGDIESDIPSDIPSDPSKAMDNPISLHATGISASEAIHEKDNEWSHIHQQMNQVDDIESSDSSDSSDSSETEEKIIRTEIQDIEPPENNSANIDEILAGKNIITDNSLSDILNVDSDLTRIDEFINTIKANESTKEISTDYEKMTVSQLKKILSDKDLPVSGNKTKLIERIKENSK